MSTIMHRTGNYRLGMSRIGLALALLGIGFTLAGCGYNTIPTLEETAKARWGDVQNQYQRRTDLIPNLVETVKGFAAQEKSVLTSVVEARAKATQVKVDVSDPPPIFGEGQDDDRKARQGGCCGRRGWRGLRLHRLADLLERINPDRLGDVLELFRAKIVDREVVAVS